VPISIIVELKSREILAGFFMGGQLAPLFIFQFVNLNYSESDIYGTLISWKYICIYIETIVKTFAFRV
jgi:hypothetical protein